MNLSHRIWGEWKMTSTNRTRCADSTDGLGPTSQSPLHTHSTPPPKTLNIFKPLAPHPEGQEEPASQRKSHRPHIVLRQLRQKARPGRVICRPQLPQR